MTTENNWKTTHPDAVGLYIASTTRRADSVRAWTGKHWTAPVMVYDLHLRCPQVDGPPAHVRPGEPIEWLEEVTVSAEGWISWGGLLNECPLHRDVPAQVRLRGGLESRAGEPFRDLIWRRGQGAGDVIAYRVLESTELAAPMLSGGCTPAPACPAANECASVGDVKSDARGSGARFNAGKADLALVPLKLLAQALIGERAQTPDERRACEALSRLGDFQETHETRHLFEALRLLGTEGWEECAHVFTYGAKKYAAWNWSKGMAWSIPLACAARHIVFGMLRGEGVDPESGKPHRGHVFCNVVMLLAFQAIFPEGNDLPTHWLPRAA